MQMFKLIVFYTLVATFANWGLYLLGGGEMECFRTLAVSGDHPLTCHQGVLMIIGGFFGFIGAVFMVPMWVWLRSARRLPSSTLLSLGLSAIVPILLGVGIFALRQPQAETFDAMQEAFEIAAPQLIAIVAVAVASWSMSKAQGQIRQSDI